MAGLGLDKDFLNVSIVNANENIFIRGESGAANQVISYDADRRIQFTDIPNDNDNIAVSNPITKSVVGDTHTIGLGFETTDFQLSASNKLELKDDFVKTASNPLSVSTQNVSLNFNTGDFQLDGSNKLELKDDFVKTASNPLSVSTQNVSLNFNTGDFQLDGSNKLELKDDFVKTASSPLSISTGNISINLSSLSGVESIVVDSYAGLSIKYGTTTSFKIDSSGGISMFGLPTSNYGLASGRIWNKGGALNIV